MISDMVLLQHTAYYKGKLKIQDSVGKHHIWSCRATIQKHASFQNQTSGR